MTDLTPRECELVALGAALGSNCIPCIDHHIPQSRLVGLSDAQIRAAIELADSVRQVPARKVLEAARLALGDASAAERRGADVAGNCAAIGQGTAKRCC